MLTLAEQAERVREADRAANAEETASAMKRQLNRWQREGLIRAGWTVTLDPAAGEYLAGFQVTGETKPHAPMQWPLFRAYADGFNARRTAIMHRKPKPAARKKTDSKKKANRV